MPIPPHVSLFLHAAAPFGKAWVGARRNLYRRIAEPIPPRVLHRVGPWFDSRLLARVEIARVPFISNPFPMLNARRPLGSLDLRAVRGMALIDTIVLADANLSSTDDIASLIFHELVHIVQYHILGARCFVRAYLRGWIDAGRSYLDNPLEAMAFELQERFDAPHHGTLDVEGEVRRRLLIR